MNLKSILLKALTFVFGVLANVFRVINDIGLGWPAKIFGYVFNVGVGIDQLFTTFLGGWPDESLSSWAHRMYVKKKWFGWTRTALNALFFLQVDHCLEAYERERLRAQLPPLLR